MYKHLGLVLLVQFAHCRLPGQTVPGDVPIGHVTRFAGSWRDESCGCRVDQGHTVLRRSGIVRQGPKRRTDFVKIRFWVNQQEELFDCGKLNCDEPLDILARVPNDNPNQLANYVLAALEAIKETMSVDGQRSRTLSGYARSLSRGQGEVILSDGVVILTRNGSVDLTALFATAVRRTYQLDFCPINGSGLPVCAGLPDPIRASFDSAGKIVCRPRIRNTGLYELFICQTIGTRVVRDSSAFVLVTSRADEAARIRADYRTFSSLLERWDSEERSMLLHAYLQKVNLSGGR